MATQKITIELNEKGKLLRAYDADTKKDVEIDTGAPNPADPVHGNWKIFAVDQDYLVPHCYFLNGKWWCP